MPNWKPRNKYEVAPGLFIGSEMGDLNREQSKLIAELLDKGGDDSVVLARLREIGDRKMELLTPKRLRRRKWKS